MTTEMLTRYRRVRSRDLDEAREQVSEVFCPHRLDALGPWPRVGAPFRGVRFNSTRFGVVGLSYASYGATMRMRRPCRAAFVSVQIPIAGRALVRAAGEEVVADVCMAAVPDPDADLDTVVTQTMNSLAERLNLTLE